MEWLFDPGIWVGLVTLVVLEIVLGIDNLVFIAILAEKLPPQQRDKARIIGLGLALVMRLGLLSVISWLVSLTAPLFTIGPLDFSGRDLILLLGGAFLLVKATMELHERLEGAPHAHAGSKAYASFGVVVAQIVALDAVFSLDSVITAVGMVDELGVMMAAVMIAIAIMMLASKPLTRFVNAHPTVVVLCLSFLLMIGFSLLAEGLGFHIPKGYLYAAIGFSIAIEFFNQLARRNRLVHQSRIPLRGRTADTVMRLLGGRNEETDQPEVITGVGAGEPQPFAESERSMVSSVLKLGERSVRSVMTPRTEITWINVEDSPDDIRQQLRTTPHSFLPVCVGNLDRALGVARAKDLLERLTAGESLTDRTHLRPLIVVHETTGVLKAIDVLKHAKGQLVVVADEFGTIQGLITPVDILEAIAGEFPDEDEQLAVRVQGKDQWLVNGTIDLHYLEQVLGHVSLVQEDDDYTSLGGYLLARFGSMPVLGEVLNEGNFQFKIAELDERRIKRVQITRVGVREESTT